MRPKIIISLNTSWNLLNFRAGLIKSLVLARYEVLAVAPRDEYSPRLEALGCRFVPMPIDSKGINPARDFLLFLRFIRLLRIEQPSIFLGYTVKPNIYGSLAANILGIPVINNISGLGAVFIKNGLLASLVRGLYRIALSRSARVFFQNEDDRQLFISEGLVSESVADLVPGSGVDLVKFHPLKLPNRSPIRFLLIARMLWDKGVGEFVEAARILKRRGVAADFCLVGFLDVQNPTAISRAVMESWHQEGVVRYFGESENVIDEIANADCIVLPSYREGTPRILLEAAAMARPIITTNAVGCKEVVDHEVNGYLCRIRDALDLADKMTMMVNLSPKQREEMGLLGREKVEKIFDEKIVIKKYLKVISLFTNQTNMTLMTG